MEDGGEILGLYNHFDFIVYGLSFMVYGLSFMEDSGEILGGLNRKRNKKSCVTFSSFYLVFCF